MCHIGTIVNLLSSILTILLICPNNDTLLCYSNDPLLTVYMRNGKINDYGPTPIYNIGAKTVYSIVQYTVRYGQPMGYQGTDGKQQGSHQTTSQ